MLETKISQYWMIAKWIALWLFHIFSNPINITQPLDVSKIDQSTTATFTVTKEEQYRISLMFVRAGDLTEMKEQEKITGNYHVEGVPLLLELTITQDGGKISQQTYEVSGINGWHLISYGGRELNTAERLIKVLSLAPGDYEIRLETKRTTEAFKDIQTYASFSYYNFIP